jgi:hypothetical protein
MHLSLATIPIILWGWLTVPQWTTIWPHIHPKCHARIIIGQHIDIILLHFDKWNRNQIRDKIRKFTLKVCPIYDVLSDLLQSNRVKHTHTRTLVHDTINGIYSQTPERFRVLSKYDFLCWINVREYRRGNTIWTIQRNWILVGVVCGSELARQGNLTTFRQYLLWTWV